MEFEEMEKFLNLANECINDGHAENLKFLQLIRFRIEIDGEYFVCSLSNSGKTLGNKYAADHDKYYYMLKDSVLTKVDGEWVIND
jgi:hypothetical protein